ncbi:MAG: winged helix-turn-helix transcriptional regulator [Kordiimonadaceae bacterium]|nr:winged helix-turn-helix transcriptional regulator [Kordiimonadaceae bacterium]
MTDDANKTLVLPNFLPYKLAVLSNRISRGIADQYEERFQLTVPEWRVMAVLGGEPDLSASQVADRTAMDKVAVSRAVKGLMKADRLLRHFSATDKRRSVLKLSDSGEVIYAQVVPIAIDYEDAILNELTKEEQSQLNVLLNKLQDIEINTAHPV